MKETKRICGGYNSIGFGSSVLGSNFDYSGNGIMPNVFESFVFSIDAKGQYFYENNYHGSADDIMAAFGNSPDLGWD